MSTILVCDLCQQRLDESNPCYAHATYPVIGEKIIEVYITLSHPITGDRLDVCQGCADHIVEVVSHERSHRVTSEIKP